MGVCARVCVRACVTVINVGRYTAPDGVYPCPHPNGACSAPAQWYPELSLPLGPPLGPYSRTGWLYTRQFAHADVTFDANNVTASSVAWH